MISKGEEEGGWEISLGKNDWTQVAEKREERLFFSKSRIS